MSSPSDRPFGSMPGVALPSPAGVAVERRALLATIEHSAFALLKVPEDAIDDEIADVFAAAHPGEMDALPADKQTPERLAMVIRRGAATAAVVCPAMMTAGGLALARSLYARDPVWIEADRTGSALPTKPGRDTLLPVWAGVLGEQDCLVAVRHGESLDLVPRGLRTPAVVNAALEADIANIAFVDAARITPELAERAARCEHACVIGSVPPALLTQQLCNTAVGLNAYAFRVIPPDMRTVALCVDALADDAAPLCDVPPHLQIEVCTRLIEMDLAPWPSGMPRPPSSPGSLGGSQWHVFRAWPRLRQGDLEGALADAQRGLPEFAGDDAHYVLACTLRAMGRHDEARAAAAKVLARGQSPYEFQLDWHEDTSWLEAYVASGAQAAPPNPTKPRAPTRWERLRSLFTRSEP